MLNLAVLEAGMAAMEVLQDGNRTVGLEDLASGAKHKTLS